jgi:hypothetical protein
VIITTGRIRRTLVNKINLLVDSPRFIEASRLALVKAESIFLRRTSGCFGTSRRSSSTTPPRAGSSSTTSSSPRVRVPRHVARLVMRLVASLVVDYSASRRLFADYFIFVARPGASARLAARHASRRAARRRLLRPTQARRRRLLRLRRASGCLGMSRGSSRGSSRRSSSTTPPSAGSSSTTSSSPRVRVPRHVARLVMRLVAPLVVIDYFVFATRLGASARRAARHAACRAVRRRLLRLAQARRRLLRLRLASGCLGTSRGSSCRSSRRSSSSTTLSSSRVWVPRHVAQLVMRLVARPVVDYSASRRLVVDYFVFAARPGASPRRAARHAARRAARRRLLRLAQASRRLLRLRRTSGCLGTSRGSSRGSSRRSSSSTTLSSSRVRVPRHVARLVMRLVAPPIVNYSALRRLVVDYFVFAARPGASARRAARHAARRAARRRRLLCHPHRLRRSC